MYFSEFFGWWYGVGWADQLRRIKLSLARVSDFFSIRLLFANLFKPFREIGAKPIEEQSLFSNFIDALISRSIGFFMRFIMIIFGISMLFLSIIVFWLRLVIWPLLPLAPVAGLILAGML